MEKLIKNKMKKYINDNLETFPFIARFWDIEVIQSQPIKSIYPISYGHFQTSAVHIASFYKPISKIIDLSHLNEK